MARTDRAAPVADVGDLSKRVNGEEQGLSEHIISNIFIVVNVNSRPPCVD